MNSPRWQKTRWLPRFLAVPVPEPTQQASRILMIQRNIILPARVMVALVVFYYLFYKRWVIVESPTWNLVIENQQRFFILYVIFNAIVAIPLILRRFPARVVQWVVFTMGLLDGLLLAGLTLETNGFESTLYWVFPGLIMVNALSIPLAMPQLVLNLSLSGFYLAAGLMFITVSESDSTIYPTPALIHHIGPAKFQPGDISDLPSFTARLLHPRPADPLSSYLLQQFSSRTREALLNYQGGADSKLQSALADDLNRIIEAGPLYNTNRFAAVNLSKDTQQLLAQKTNPSETNRLNRRLLLDAYPKELMNKKPWSAAQDALVNRAPVLQGLMVENETEPFLLRLIILWLLAASCYGLQLLLFRQRLADEEERKSLARNDELKAAGRLAAEIAHQLKNPLGIINNAVYSLQKGLREGKRDFTQQMQIIREEIDRSDRILTQLMGYAQLSEGRVERLDVAHEIDQAIAEVLPAGANYAVKIQRRYAAGLPILLMQKMHFSTIIINLLQNAREALEGRGNIEVSARLRNDTILEVIVGDDGPGISFDKLDQIFQAYISTKEKGTGLGLAIVKHNMELYGGEVRVESELGKGARFILSFPAKAFIVTTQ